MSLSSLLPETIVNPYFYDFPPAMLHANNKHHLNRAHSLEVGQMVLVQNQFSGLQDPSSLHITATPRPELMKGRGYSAHEVMAYELMCETKYDQEIPTIVAAKPYPKDVITIFGSKPQSLVHEWAANEAVTELSNYERSYLPMGIWNKDGVLQFLTLFDEPVQSYDNVFWAKGEKANATGRERIVSALASCLYAVGVLHGGGLVHGDPQVKNFARDTKHTRFIDLETLGQLDIDRVGIIGNTSENRAAIFESVEESDLIEFARSTLGPGRSGKNKAEHNTDMFDKVAGVISDQTALRDVVKCYFVGIRQGNHYSGFRMEHGVLPEAADLVDMFKQAVDVRV